MTEKILKATHEGDLVIGELHLPSAVLEDGTRVLLSKGFLKALGRPWKGSSRTELPNFLGAKNLIPFVDKDLQDGLNSIKYKSLKKGVLQGYKAEILPLVCDVYLRARDGEVLTTSQLKVAKQAEILVRSLSKIGIIALIDEATGYQYERDQEELQRILEKYIRSEFLPWTKRFPDDFYRELFRLRGWSYSPLSVKRPILVGKLTNKIIYKYLPKGVLEELKKRTPKGKTGHYIKRLHQSLTTDIGNPHLERHLARVVTRMRISPNWRTFERHFKRAFGEQQEFGFVDELEENKD